MAISAEEQQKKSDWKGATLRKRLKFLENIIVPFPEFTKVVKEIRRRVLRCIGIGKGDSLHVVAETGAAKTTIATSFKRLWPDKDLLNGTRKRVVVIEPPATPTALAMTRLLLRQLGDPLAFGRRGLNAPDVLHDLLIKCKTRLVIVDNYQDIPERRKESGISEIAGWQRAQIDRVPALFLTIGSKASLQVVRANQQIQRRSPAHLKINYFNCRDDKGFNTFARMLYELDKRLPLAEMSGLGRAEVVKRMFAATNGIFDFIIGILVEAVEIAVQNKKEAIDLNDLAAGFDAHFRDAAPSINPFTCAEQGRLLDREGEPFHKWGQHER